MKSSKMIKLLNLLSENECDIQHMIDKYDNIVDINGIINSYKELEYCSTDYNRSYSTIKIEDVNRPCRSCPFSIITNDSFKECLIFLLMSVDKNYINQIHDIYELIGILKNEISSVFINNIK